MGTSKLSWSQLLSYRGKKSFTLTKRYSIYIKYHMSFTSVVLSVVSQAFGGFLRLGRHHLALAAERLGRARPGALPPRSRGPRGRAAGAQPWLLWGAGATQGPAARGLPGGERPWAYEIGVEGLLSSCSWRCGAIAQ